MTQDISEADCAFETSWFIK